MQPRSVRAGGVTVGDRLAHLCELIAVLTVLATTERLAAGVRARLSGRGLAAVPGAPVARTCIATHAANARWPTGEPASCREPEVRGPGLPRVRSWVDSHRFSRDHRVMNPVAPTAVRTTDGCETDRSPLLLTTIPGASGGVRSVTEVQVSGRCGPDAIRLSRPGVSPRPTQGERLLVRVAQRRGRPRRRRRWLP
jgi:hypothetical protein